MATISQSAASPDPASLTVEFKGTPRVFSTELVVDRPRDKVFPFFADAKNLQAITPEFLDFRVVTPGEIRMEPGTLIDYRLKVHGIPLRWRTLITVWDPPHRFVDVQLKGPYRLWHHEHTFEPVGEGRTRCRDIVHYAHWGGPIVEKLLVRPDIERIFQHRTNKLGEMFGAE